MSPPTVRKAGLPHENSLVLLKDGYVPVQYGLELVGDATVVDADSDHNNLH